MKSKGLGDTIEKITTATGVKKAVELASEITGVPCGCGSRKDSLNKLYNYEKIKQNWKKVKGKWKLISVKKL
jgi:glycerol dehydrogenase-like iron-containing ADH family enzyme